MSCYILDKNENGLSRARWMNENWHNLLLFSLFHIIWGPIHFSKHFWYFVFLLHSAHNEEDNKYIQLLAQSARFHSTNPTSREKIKIWKKTNKYFELHLTVIKGPPLGIHFLHFIFYNIVWYSHLIFHRFFFFDFFFAFYGPLDFAIFVLSILCRI